MALSIWACRVTRNSGPRSLCCARRRTPGRVPSCRRPETPHASYAGLRSAVESSFRPSRQSTDLTLPAAKCLSEQCERHLSDVTPSSQKAVPRSAGGGDDCEDPSRLKRRRRFSADDGYDARSPPEILGGKRETQMIRALSSGTMGFRVRIGHTLGPLLLSWLRSGAGSRPPHAVKCGSWSEARFGRKHS